MDDLISRKEALRIATQHHDFFKYATVPTDKARRDELLNVMCWLNELPAVEPKTAHWKTHIFDGIMGGRPRAYMCGYCNFISLAQTNYCPHCGAEMTQAEGKERWDG